ncbi:CpsD/CapB family tyrosine-protein kinase [Methylicorpusculum sp.]|uniref:CpsD/CapB family tyrosine-protein kinase n=1 Tax=Methylicorpusculum sp. TaxID=2713644 RepID=UPI0027248F6C|nr:CpsD/CapB family tyrosine-protein kinase [Methylicorpusculum sp.]MDO8844253.1 CpsD/CapB family tyrosine-protein kinase [Methylicorpusculum sp.]MDP2180331.1 CpsD/CapB family tyrosine-protein kinase [Methylicorpusculum sp.]MDP3531482.1 CpsD/CapB family tyrosine-protein kinase [Methylicorpusculum sp.]MDZ4152760.1 CpsD/CapB family tyrosine-protein kinase [Methylicorpusculum sp.]
MERIHKALEKAREQRNRPGNKPQPRAGGKTNYVTAAAVQEIKYTQTQTVEISQQLLKQNRVVAHLKDNETADLFKILRTKVLQRMSINGWNMLAVTSPTAGVGKSLTAVNLAISLAMEGNHSVLLADLDLRRPNIHHYFGISSPKGIVDYFTDDVPINELFINPSIERLVLLPAGKPIRQSSELLATPKMLNLVNELKNRYSDRLIIVDLPPLMSSDDAMVFLPYVDACLLVVAEGLTTNPEIERSLQLIEEKKYLGSVLNKSAEIWSPAAY